MKSLFEQMGGTYRQEGDYLILALPAEEDKPIGIWRIVTLWQRKTENAI